MTFFSLADMYSMLWDDADFALHSAHYEFDGLSLIQLATVLFSHILCQMLNAFNFIQIHSLCVFHQIKYAGSDTDCSLSPAFCKQIRRVESEGQKAIGTQTPLQQLLEGLIADKELPAKDKRKRLKQVCPCD